MKAIKPQRPPPPKRKRSPAFLIAQIVGGGVVGIGIAMLVLKYLGADYFGFGRAPEGPIGISDSRKIASEKPPINPPKKPGNHPVQKQPARTQKPGDSAAKPIAKSSPDPLIPGDEPTTETPKETAPVEAKERVPLSKESLAEFFVQAKLSPATKYWWCEKGVFELNDRGGFQFVLPNGGSSHYWPVEFTEQYLELDNEPHSQRVRLFADHAESASEPFTTYTPLYTAGKWIVTSDQTGLDWFARGIVELDATSRQSRVAAKEYMTKLFEAAEKLKAANKLKDVPFGFDLAAEKERFARTGFVPWTAPLLPMTAEYIQECRKMHRNEQSAYDRISLRLNGQREKAAKDFLEYHQWRFARAWPLAILAWKGESGADAHYALLSNGVVNIESSKDTWKLTGDILDVDIGEKRVRLKIHQQGKEFSLIGADPPVTGKFLYEGARVAY